MDYKDQQMLKKSSLSVKQGVFSRRTSAERSSKKTGAVFRHALRSEHFPEGPYVRSSMSAKCCSGHFYRTFSGQWLSVSPCVKQYSRKKIQVQPRNLFGASVERRNSWSDPKNPFMVNMRASVVSV